VTLKGIIVAAPLLLALTACTSLGETGDKGFISGDGQVRVIDASDRDRPVEFSGTSLTGEPIDSKDYRGRVLVVNKWWSGCGPCRSEMPMLSEASEDPGHDAAFLGIDIRDSSADNGLAFMKGVGADYPSIYDPKGRAALAFSGKAPMAAIPTTVVLDTEGRVASVISGPLPSKQTLLDVIDDVADGTADG
jgi:thiol-disulfide isomerase/thioredoxin